MKRTFCTLSILFVLSYNAFSQKYWAEGSVSNLYKSNKTYKVAILPIESLDSELKDRNELMSIAYNKLSLVLTAKSNIQLVNQAAVKQSCNKYAFGGGAISYANYKQIAADLNANLLVFVQLSREKRLIKKKEIGTIMAFIQFFDVEMDNTVIYSGKGRSINPLSDADEVEVAIDKALEKFKKAK